MIGDWFIAVDGHPTTVDAYLATPAGHDAALRYAQAIYDDPDLMARYEHGLDTYPSAVARLLDELVEAPCR